MRLAPLNFPPFRQLRAGIGLAWAGISRAFEARTGVPAICDVDAPAGAANGFTRAIGKSGARYSETDARGRNYKVAGQEMVSLRLK